VKQKTFRIAMALVLTGIAVTTWQVGILDEVQNSSNSFETVQDSQSDAWKSQVRNETPVNATFAGGCFWCIEGVYMGVEGVEAAISGYAGGKASTATYDQVTTGTTDHRESVRVRYYPSIISYGELLDMYWKSIDPTDAGGQFSDRGQHYTTAIYTHKHKQYRLARQSKENLSESGKFEEPIVTEIKNYTTFFRAEDRHQNYSRKNTARYKAYERASGRKGFIQDTWDQSPLG
jgi:methionine-S-sulfoxide reductase